ncbi:MAG: LysR family transcriptional regulator [Eubacteriales bacterium]
MVKQKITFKLYSADEPRAFFGPGPYLLLKQIEETHSIAKAAKRMNMAYTKALSLLRRAETALGQPLVAAKTGGHGGGGSELTETAKAMIAAFSECQASLDAQAEALYHQHFSFLSD